MSGRKRPDVDLVAVADAGATYEGASTRSWIPPGRPTSRSFGCSSLVSRTPLFRLFAQVVIVLGVGAAVAVAVFRGPRPGSHPTSPLVPPACATGLCSATSMTDAELLDVQVALPGGKPSGLQQRDPHNVPVSIQVVSTDGHGVLSINAARVSHAPAGWASENIARGPAGTEPDGRARCRAKPHRSGRVGGRGTRHHPVGVYDAAPSHPRPGRRRITRGVTRASLGATRLVSRPSGGHRR